MNETEAPVSSSACDSASADALIAATQSSEFGSRVVQPLGLEQVKCSGDWAIARTVAHNESEQAARLLFRYSGGGWNAINLGSGAICGDVPAGDAAALGCG